MKWYEDPVYIDMCKKAIEIQHLHKPQVTDYYRCACSSCAKHGSTYNVNDYDIDRINNRDLTDVEPTYAKMVQMADVSTFAAYYFDRDEEHLSYIWLPSQSQLQYFISKEDPFLRKICNYSKKHLSQEAILNISLLMVYYPKESQEMLWLRSVMKDKFGKKWNKSDFVKIGNKNTEKCPDCSAPLVSGSGGGVICSKKCGYWFCY